MAAGMTRRWPWIAAAALVGALGVTAMARFQTSTLIVNASIVDGTGSPARTGAVRIADGRIAEVGNLSPRHGDSIVDARGLLVGMTQRLVELTNRLAELSGGRIEARLARLFLKLADNSGKPQRGGWFGHGGVLRVGCVCSRLYQIKISTLTVTMFSDRLVVGWGEGQGTVRDKWDWPTSLLTRPSPHQIDRINSVCIIDVYERNDVKKGTIQSAKEHPPKHHTAAPNCERD